MKVLFKIKENGDLKIEKSGRLTKIEKILLISLVEKINTSFSNSLLTINSYNRISFNTFSCNVKFAKPNNAEEILNYALLNLEYEDLDELTCKYMQEKENNKIDFDEVNKFEVDQNMLEMDISIEDQKELHKALKMNLVDIEDIKFHIIKSFAAVNNMYVEDVEFIDQIISA